MNGKGTTKRTDIWDETVRNELETSKIHGFLGVFSAVGSKTLLEYLQCDETNNHIQNQLVQQFEAILLGKLDEVRPSEVVMAPAYADVKSKQEPMPSGEQYEDLAETDEAGYEEYHSTISTPSNNPNALKTTPLYNFLWKNIEWQRDNYFIGQQHADRRKRERAMDSFYSKFLGSHFLLSRIPNADSDALGFLQITSLVPSLLPSSIVYKSALPLVTALPYGVLREPLYQAAASIIPASQITLDEVVKTSLIQVFHNDQFKELVQSSFRNQAEGFLIKNIPGGEKDWQ
jgi:hypothetical protein